MPSGEWSAQIPVKQTLHGGFSQERDIWKHWTGRCVSVPDGCFRQHQAEQGINGLPQRILRDNTKMLLDRVLHFQNWGTLSRNIRDPRSLGID